MNQLIEVGKDYGYVHVDKIADKPYRTYECECKKCGNKFLANRGLILKYSETGCAKCRVKDREIAEEKDIIGKVFGNLKVIEYMGSEKIYNYPRGIAKVVKCECLKCGSVTEMPLYKLKSGRVKECKLCAMKNLDAGIEVSKMAAKEGTSVLFLKNQGVSKNSTTGHNGVSALPNGKYRAYINFKRKQYYLGSFDKLEDAVAARQSAEKEFYGSFLDWYQKEYPKEWNEIEKTRKKNRPES